MTTTARNAARSYRVIAHINLRQARAFRRAGLGITASHHVACALEARVLANSILRTARPL